MSRQLINEYRADLDRLRSYTGSRRESILREAFKDLLKRWGRSQDLLLVAEYDMITPMKTRISVDGALLHALRVPFGYWEAKDEDDDLDAEIANKFRKGYPRSNIIFSDDRTAVLFQEGAECRRVAMDDTDKLHDLLTLFFAHEREEIADFNKAVKQFAADLPAVLEALRSIIADKRTASPAFAAAETAFLAHAKKAINPAVSQDDVQEMLIQHVLTADIFAKVFNNPDFHRHNNVASELFKLEEQLFGYGERQKLLKALAPYYAGISATAAVIESHSEKQGFLKGLYENFYKVYNAKAADRLGVVYTPGEIVRFMIRSADWLCEKHFGKNLIDRGVEILDPATGTFIVELLEHFRGDHAKLRHKYKEELHANEIAILPYYVANLNIEATYQAITGQFAEYPNLCLVDTLDNVDALGIHSGHQFDLLGSLSDENIERIKRQNRRKISVIIGNPPYNANQQNENDNNKNRTYAHIDKRIKNTYIASSTAQKTKLYDMYARFFRWASDRLGDEGVLAFITNRSFIDSRTFDGFRKTTTIEFDEIYVIDLGGDYKRKDFAGGANVFGIGTGVAISFWIRRSRNKSFAKVRYSAIQTNDIDDKLSQLGVMSIDKLSQTDGIAPDKSGNWLQIGSAFPSEMLSIADRLTKGRSSSPRSIFGLFTLGVVTNRDEWVYDVAPKQLLDKVLMISETYSSEKLRYALASRPERDAFEFDSEIKWTRHLKNIAKKGAPLSIDQSNIIRAQFRPYHRQLLYFDASLNEMQYRNREAFGPGLQSSVICFSAGQRGPFVSVASNLVPSLDMFLPNACQSLPRYRYTKSGDRIDNITDWALNKFIAHYGKKGMSKDAIFHYVYAVLHDPIYRETYALNLKREFPRIPFYPDFARWAKWGEELMAMHIGYEAVEPWAVERIDVPAKRAAGTAPKPILRSDPSAGSVIIDADTQITGIPPHAWDYRLGNRSAIDWVLDQHKEKKPRDPTIAAKFNTYRFADYKESMIALLAKVVRVSVETVAITEAMKLAERDPGSSPG